MIYEELLIDGVSVDMSEDTDITLEINSNIFNDITEITTNRSYTISLPKTVRNMTLLGNCDKIGISGKIPFTFHNCEYRRNGVPIIRNGRATIKECKEYISVNIYWGLFPFLEKLIEENKNLNELSSDAHILFNSRNEPYTLEKLLADGFGYADYYPYEYKDSEGDWSSDAFAQVSDETIRYELVSGKIYTGQEVGSTSSGGIIADNDYQCFVKEFTVGQKAKIYNVAGVGDYRSYAVLDSGGNVLEIAPEPSNDGTSNGRLDVATRASFTQTAYVFPLIKNLIHVDKIEYYVEGNGHSGTLQYGFIDALNNEIQLLGSVPVTADSNKIATLTLDIDKPEGKYIFIRQTDASQNFLMGYNDSTGQSDLGRYDEDEDRYWETTNYNVCFKVYYTSEKYNPSNYSITAPADAAKLVVNNNINYSTIAYLTITGQGQSFVPEDAFGTLNALQPVVTCWWALQQIMADYGITISWGSTAERYIKGLAMPLVTRDADALTLTGGLTAAMKDRTSLGKITIIPETLPVSFKQVSGEVTQLEVTTDCSLKFDVQVYCKWYVSDEPSGTTTSGFDGQITKENYWLTYPDYIKMKITHSQASGEDPDEYIVGTEDYSTTMRITESQIVDGIYTSLIVGVGEIDLTDGDVITFELANKGGTHNGLTMYDGTIKAQLVDNDEVPYGGQFPIVKNLGDISITDYIKTLNLLSGTFPLQKFENGTISMSAFDALWDNIANAVDWTKKLIPYDNRNRPRDITYSVDGYYQHNYYKWKEDDKTKGNYDSDLRIENETLENENDAFELPFAASNGDRVPLYSARTGITGTFAGSNRDETTTTTSTSGGGGEYSSCEPRIMNLLDDGEGNAKLDFQINLDNIFAEKYANLINTITNAVVITEYLYLSDLEIMNFDETIPVYFAQYGAYFAVLSIKVSSDGYSEVEMIKLNI